MQKRKVAEAVSAAVGSHGDKDRDAAALVSIFWAAPAEALFDQRIVAPVLNRSEGWLEKGRVFGYGPKFRKDRRAVRYRKSDVVDYIDGMQTARSTADYGASADRSAPA